jgi:putative ABC transport system permease protein
VTVDESDSDRTRRVLRSQPFRDRKCSLQPRMIHEIRIALRSASHRPWLAGALVCLVGGAIAINTALYSALDLLVLRGLPGRDTASLVVVRGEWAGSTTSVSQKEFDGISQHPAFVDTSALTYGEWWSADGVRVEGLSAARAMPNLLRLLGVAPAYGRWFVEDDATAVVQPIVIGWDLWNARFGRDVSVIGRPVEFAGARFIVIGVMPARFDFPFGTNVWLTLPRRSGMAATTSSGLTVLARLRAAQGSRRIRLDTATFAVVGASDYFDPKGLPSLILLLAGSLLMFAVSAAQVLSLTLTQAVDRRAVAALRVVLGAERRHLLQQAVAEAVLPAVGGFIVASVAVPWLQGMARHWIPPELLRDRQLHSDPQVIVFAAALSLAVLLVLAVAHYATVPWRSPGEVMRSGSCSTIRSRGHGRIPLLVAQTAVAVSLLYLAVVTADGFVRLLQVDLGFAPDHLYVIQLPWGQRSLSERRAERHLVEDSLAAVVKIPGVTAAVATGSRPFGGPRVNVSVTLPDRTERRVALELISPGYFKVMGIPLRAGRDFDTHDLIGASARVVVNESLATVLRDRRSLIGERVRLGGFTREVVGIVGDVRALRPDQPAPLQAYLCIDHGELPPEELIFRTRPGPYSSVQAGVSAVLTRVWRRRPNAAQSFSDLISALLAPFRVRGLFLAMLAGAAFVLTAAGLAGGLVDGVRARRGELAVRMALGATREHVRWAVLRHAVTVTCAGLVIGLAAGVAITRAVSSVVYGVTLLAPVALLAVAAPFVLIAILAGRRAGRVASNFEPADSLKTM